ncbi:MAG TPA: hypothetical protein PLU67_08235 [Candidatus Kapabacteria bacterium]|nr:hypothetical protein [Candidatus Kapabacteria bacterium]HOM05464.1 hypothetical protein [Candidatus Kapabacteria bacterium]HOQ48281.1 hypothetical protein [Candidatus Kapabacteria bacterium]HPP40800.1 hypothetical protein [Candidatus Kapabacteria bacterium]
MALGYGLPRSFQALFVIPFINCYYKELFLLGSGVPPQIEGTLPEN